MGREGEERKGRGKGRKVDRGGDGRDKEGIRKWVEGLTREWKDRRNG